MKQGLIACMSLYVTLDALEANEHLPNSSS